MTEQTESTSMPRVGPVGLYVHTLVDSAARQIQYQGTVIGTDFDYVLVQIFSWVDGRPTKVIGIPRDRLYGPLVSLYADREEWLMAGEGMSAA